MTMAAASSSGRTRASVTTVTSMTTPTITILLLSFVLSAAYANQSELCSKLCKSIDGDNQFYEGSCYCILPHEPTEAEKPGVEAAKARGKAEGMTLYTSVVGPNAAPNRDERCLIGLASALRERARAAKDVFLSPRSPAGYVTVPGSPSARGADAGAGAEERRRIGVLEGLVSIAGDAIARSLERGSDSKGERAMMSRSDLAPANAPAPAPRPEQLLVSPALSAALGNDAPLVAAAPLPAASSLRLVPATPDAAAALGLGLGGGAGRASIPSFNAVPMTNAGSDPRSAAGLGATFILSPAPAVSAQAAPPSPFPASPDADTSVNARAASATPDPSLKPAEKQQDQAGSGSSSNARSSLRERAEQRARPEEAANEQGVAGAGAAAGAWPGARYSDFVVVPVETAAPFISAQGLPQATGAFSSSAGSFCNSAPMSAYDVIRPAEVSIIARSAAQAAGTAGLGLQKSADAVKSASNAAVGAGVQLARASVDAPVKVGTNAANAGLNVAQSAVDSILPQSTLSNSAASAGLGVARSAVGQVSVLPTRLRQSANDALEFLLPSGYAQMRLARQSDFPGGGNFYPYGSGPQQLQYTPSAYGYRAATPNEGGTFEMAASNGDLGVSQSAGSSALPRDSLGSMATGYGLGLAGSAVNGDGDVGRNAAAGGLSIAQAAIASALQPQTSNLGPRSVSICGRRPAAVGPALLTLTPVFTAVPAPAPAPAVIAAPAPPCHAHSSLAHANLAAQQYAQRVLDAAKTLAGSTQQGVQSVVKTGLEGGKTGAEEIGQFAGSAASTAQDYAQAAGQGLQSAAQDVVYTAGQGIQNVGQGIHSVAHNVAQGAVQGVEGAFSTIQGAAQGVGQGVQNAAHTGLNYAQSAGQGIHSFAHNTAQGAVQGAQNVYGTAQGAVQTVGQGIQNATYVGIDFAQSAGQGIHNIAHNAAQGAVQGVQGVLTTAQGAAQIVGQGIQNVTYTGLDYAQSAGQGIHNIAHNAAQGTVQDAQTVFSTVQGAAQSAGQGIQNVAQTGLDYAQSAGQGIHNIAQGAVQGVVQGAQGAYGTVQDAAGTAHGLVHSAADTVHTAAYQLAHLGEQDNGGQGPVQGDSLSMRSAAMQGVEAAAQGLVRSAADQGSQAVQGAISSVRDAAQSAVTQGGQLVQGAKVTARDLLQSATNAGSQPVASAARSAGAQVADLRDAAVRRLHEALGRAAAAGAARYDSTPDNGNIRSSLASSLRQVAMRPSQWAQAAIDGVASDATDLGMAGAAVASQAQQTLGDAGRRGLGAVGSGLGVAQSAIGSAQQSLSRLGQLGNSSPVHSYGSSSSSSSSGGWSQWGQAGTGTGRGPAYFSGPRNTPVASVPVGPASDYGQLAMAFQHHPPAHPERVPVVV